MVLEIRIRRIEPQQHEPFYRVEVQSESLPIVSREVSGTMGARLIERVLATIIEVTAQRT